MRVLVMSDMHGRSSMFEKAVEKNSDAKNIIFLGDGADEAKELSGLYQDKNFYIVSGNCDMLSMLPTTLVIELANVKILITHGHKFGVKYGADKLLSETVKQSCKIALYGHTHNAAESYINGIYLFNPGCLCGNGGKSTCGMLDITEKGILFNIINL